MSDDLQTTSPEEERSAYADEESLRRRPSGFWKYALATVAVSWSAFQVLAASRQFFILDLYYMRAIHLAFALSLAFLGRPMFRKPRFGIQSLAATDRIPWYDIFLSALAVLSALYIIFDFPSVLNRGGDPLPRDIVIGLILVALLLEGCRRALGPALSVVALVLILHSFFAEYGPRILAFQNVTLPKFVGKTTMGAEGIYGIPIGVSADVVFLFVLFGAMLERAGAGRFFIQLALSVLGGFRGGPAKAAVASSGLTGLISGSSIANIVTTGTFTIPLMKRIGYPPKKAAAIEVAASTDGQLAPPIMGAAAFIIAEYLNMPYIKVIKAAAIPAFASYAALFYITHVEACKLGLERIPRAELPKFWPTLLGGLHYLLPIAVLIYYLFYEQRTPQTSVLYSLAVMGLIMLVQRPIQAALTRESVRNGLKQGFTDLLWAMNNGARNMVGVALACAGAGIIVGVVSFGLGLRITDVIEILSFDITILALFWTALACLIIGMGLPTTATYVTMAALTAGVIVEIAGNHEIAVPLVAAHLFVFYFGILADDTPPVGLAAYAAAAIAKSKPIPTGIQGFLYDIRTAILPFMFIFNADLVLRVGADIGDVRPEINSWMFALLIFGLACFGNFAFVAATQGWFITRNRWYELPFFLAVTFILMRPDYVANALNIPAQLRYWTAVPALALFVGLYLWQKRRIRRSERRKE